MAAYRSPAPRSLISRALSRCDKHQQCFSLLFGFTTAAKSSMRLSVRGLISILAASASGTRGIVVIPPSCSPTKAMTTPELKIFGFSIMKFSGSLGVEVDLRNLLLNYDFNTMEPAGHRN